MTTDWLPAPLWSDAIVWLLLAVVAGYAWRVRRSAPHRASWARVFRSRAAVASSVFLAAYAAIALADSIHVRRALAREAATTTAYAVPLTSLLDLALGHLRTRGERSYSAPFATRALGLEFVERQDASGRTVRERVAPRLRYGGAQLQDESSRALDIAWRTGAALGLAALLWVVAVLGLARWLGRGRGGWRAGWESMRRARDGVPWGAGLAALGVLLAMVVPTYVLSLQYHVLGTDKVGQDVLYQSLKAIRTSLLIGTLATLVMLPLGMGFGIAAGYFRGRTDDAIQYLYTTLNSIPGVLLIAAAVLMLQVFIESHPAWFFAIEQRADFRLLVLCAILGATGWIGLARLLRGETLKLAELEFVQAARAQGASPLRIVARHVAPNASHLVVIYAAIEFSYLVLAEAVLSYVGVGVDPSSYSFGMMINGARLELAREPAVWWALAAAFAFMGTLVLAANLFADAVRDGFDPRVRVGVAGASGEGGT